MVWKPDFHDFSFHQFADKDYLYDKLHSGGANIPNVGIRKLNSAYAVGGGPLLVSTIESNYRVDIDNYASVDFSSMASIIDMVGGV